MSRRKPYAIVTEGTPAVRRLRSTLIAVAAILVLALVWLAASVGSQIDDLESNLATAGFERAQLRTDLTAQQSALDEANQRLVEAGEKPVTTPPASGPQGIPGVEGSVGPRGEPGQRGRTGARGPRGFTGLDGTGDAGPRGVQGVAGPPGQSVTGPPGPPGPQGPQGPAGSDGGAGPPCPPGFHPEQRTIITDNGPEQAVVCVAG